MPLFGRSKDDKGAADKGGSLRNRFNLDSLRGQIQHNLSQKLFMIIKSEGHVIDSYETAGRERASQARQLSEWGESTADDAVDEITDKLGVILTQIGEVEDQYANHLEESRGMLKVIRNLEGEVGPIRDHKAKTMDEIERLKLKEPQSPKIAELEQDLTRTDAQAYVAESQLSNATREKLKAAYIGHMTALIERSEKHNMLARHGLRLMQLLDDTPIQPGTTRPPFAGRNQASEIVTSAQHEVHSWHPTHDHGAGPAAAAAGGGTMPPQAVQQGTPVASHPQAGGAMPAQAIHQGTADVSHPQAGGSIPPQEPPHVVQPPPQGQAGGATGAPTT